MIQGIAAIIVGMFIGCFVDAGRSGFSGLLFGGILGYALFAIGRLRRQLETLRADTERWQLRSNTASAEAPCPTAPVPEPTAENCRDGGIIDLIEPAEDQYVFTAQKTPPLDAGTFVSPPLMPEEKPSPTREPAVDGPPLPEWLRSLVSSENLLVKLGVIVLFFGVSFLVKYAAQHGLFPLELRLAGAALGGCALIATGWRLRDLRPVYAQSLQGGGIGILYLTTFAAMRLYHLVPTAAGFAFLVTICALSALLAILQDSRTLAILGSAGGFLAPELASIGSGGPVMLFSYYAVLNAGIIAIAWFRSWRGLNLLGFLCTFIVGAAWGGRFYHPDYFTTVEPFLVLYFLIYTAVAFLHVRRQAPADTDILDATLVFGTPIVAFALQAALVQRYEFGLAWSALSLGSFYLALTASLSRQTRREWRPLAEAFLAYGTVFSTLAIPLAFDGRWTSAAWCLEGAGIVWVSLRQQRRLGRVFGYLLLVGAGVAFLAEAALPTDAWPVLNGFYAGCLLVSGASLFTSRLLLRRSALLEPWEAGISKFLFIWGMAWWFGSGLHEIDRFIWADYRFGGFLAFVGLSCAVCRLLRDRLAWPLLDWPALGLLPAMTAYAASQPLSGMDHPGAQGGWLAWPMAITVWYAILKAEDNRSTPLHGLWHATPLWLVALLTAWECSWQIGHRQPQLATWALIAWGVLPAGLALLIARRGEGLPWPISRHFSTYLGLGSGPLVLFGWLWAVDSLTKAGDPWPLPYLPFVNPLDGATLLVMIALAGWYLKVSDALSVLAVKLPRRELRISYGGTLFLWFNAVLLRSIHHWAGVAYTPDALFGSMLVQTGLSIFWSLTALLLMTLAAQRSLRPLWATGAALLGAVVTKLFLVDLASHGTVERIVSFVVVGLLLLVIGWFAPAPPRRERGAAC